MTPREQLAGTMFDIPDPPTGPAKLPASSGSFRGYLAWRNTPEGERAWRAIEFEALSRLAAGATRISIGAVVELVRSRGMEINNTHRAWLADDLVRRYPSLLDVIERRKRTKGA